MWPPAMCCHGPGVPRQTSGPVHGGVALYRPVRAVRALAPRPPRLRDEEGRGGGRLAGEGPLLVPRPLVRQRPHLRDLPRGHLDRRLAQHPAHTGGGQLELLLPDQYLLEFAAVRGLVNLPRVCEQWVWL